MGAGAGRSRAGLRAGAGFLTWRGAKLSTVQRAFPPREQLDVMQDLISVAIGDCDGEDDEDRAERLRLEHYLAAVRYAATHREPHEADPESWLVQHGDIRVMLCWLAGYGPCPLTPLGHRHSWEPDDADAPCRGPAAVTAS